MASIDRHEINLDDFTRYLLAEIKHKDVLINGTGVAANAQKYKAEKAVLKEVLECLRYSVQGYRYVKGQWVGG